MLDMILAAAWVKLSVKVEFWIGVGILIIAIIGIIYKFVTGEWGFDDFMKGD